MLLKAIKERRFLPFGGDKEVASDFQLIAGTNRRRYLEFATSSEALWSGNFRELSASITRMATMADAGRVTEENALEEIDRLRRTWGAVRITDCVGELLGENAEELDLFDRCQLSTVIEVCRRSGSLSEAGRTLFAASRRQKKQANDADRLRKYLARFDLEWQTVR